MSVIIRDIFDHSGHLLVAKGMTATPEIQNSLRRHNVVIKKYIYTADPCQPYDGMQSAEGTQQDIEPPELVQPAATSVVDLSLLNVACQEVVEAQDWIHNHPYLRFHLTVLTDHMGWVYTHSINVATLTVMMALRLGIERTQRLELAAGALLHDVGTLFIPPEILSKPGQLTTDERAAINRHPSLGEKMLTRKGIPHRLACIVGQHHERWDGHGYPKQLKGPEIDLGAQLVGVADVFDALTSVRPHRGASTVTEAERVLSQYKNVQFNGAVVNLLLGKRT